MVFTIFVKIDSLNNYNTNYNIFSLKTKYTKFSRELGNTIDQHYNDRSVQNKNENYIYIYIFTLCNLLCLRVL